MELKEFKTEGNLPHLKHNSTQPQGSGKAREQGKTGGGAAMASRGGYRVGECRGGQGMRISMLHTSLTHQLRVIGCCEGDKLVPPSARVPSNYFSLKVKHFLGFHDYARTPLHIDYRRGQLPYKAKYDSSCTRCFQG